MRSVSSLSREEILQEIVNNHDLSPQHIYLLDLIPLIEMIWADGKTQDAEISLLYDYVIRHLAELNNEAGGEDIVTVDDANAFLDRFLATRPDPALLKSLRELALTLSQQHSDPQRTANRGNNLLNFCLDIAAAAVAEYPYEKHDRVMESEKRLLTEIMFSLRLSSNRDAP